MNERDAALTGAHRHASAWLDSLARRPVPPRASAEEVAAKLGTELPVGPSDAADVVDLLATACQPGLTAMPSGRFFGMVIGGSHPAALAADWLTSAWDQNAAMRAVTPAHTAVEDIAGRWLIDLLGLPPASAVGFVTGATMSNFTCLAAARHETVDLALRYLGLGSPEVVAADDQGRLDADELAAALADGPAIVVLQAGTVHSGVFDPFAAAVEVAHRHRAWVHVDGAFGLFAAASPAYRSLVRGYEAADSWTTDAHKTLNVPYDSGLAIVADASALRSAMGMHGDYLIRADGADPFEKVPEVSRRGRAFPVWAVLRSLGRSGVADLVDRFCRHAAAFAEGVRGIDGAEVLNDVVFTQVCASFGSDERTQAVARRMLEDGTAWMTGSRWHDRAVLRIAVSNWSTTTSSAASRALRRAAG